MQKKNQKPFFTFYQNPFLTFNSHYPGTIFVPGSLFFMADKGL